MFTLACSKHKEEYRQWKALMLDICPEITDRQLTIARLVYLASSPVDLDKCPDCRVVSSLQM